MGENLIRIGQDLVKFTGHGVGLELDEFEIFAKRLSMKIEKDMTFALEPEFVLSEGRSALKTPLL